MAHIDSRKLKSGAMIHDVVYKTSNGGKHKITGFTNKRAAERFLDNFERLMALRKTGTELTTALIEWIDDLPDEVHAKLSNDGFLTPRQKPGTLQELAEYFLNGKDVQDELKESTLRSRRTMVNRWYKFFGKYRRITDITRDDAKDYATWHESQYELATWGRELKSLKQIFNFAVEELHWIKENPFSKLKGGSQANKERFYYVTLEEVRLILEECPTAEMRLIFCLARFGGLRISEIPVLDWDCVNFQRSTLTVNIPKKTSKKAEAKGDYVTRTIPLWPELRQAFTEYWETLPEGAPMKVFPNYPSDTAIRNRFENILKRAGVPMWPKFFHSMRATRATELRRYFPEYQINAWIGHTQKVAETHYILNPVQDIESASQFATMGTQPPFSDGNQNGNMMGTKMGLQNIFESSKHFSEVKKNLQNTGSNQEKKKGLASLQTPEMTSMGLEPMPRP